jgi:hypothetical protein
MDAKHHEKIADKLMQYRGKIPKYAEVNDRIAKMMVRSLTTKIDEVLWEIDHFAKADDLGMIE